MKFIRPSMSEHKLFECPSHQCS